MLKMCVVAYPEAVVGGEGVEDLVGAPFKKGMSRWRRVGLHGLSASVMRQPSPLERGRGMWRIIPECLNVLMLEWLTRSIYSNNQAI